MTRWIRAASTILGTVPLVYPLVLVWAPAVACLAAAGLLALTAAIAAPRRVGARAWVWIVVAEYGIALGLVQDHVDTGALILAPIILIVLECLDVLTLMDAGTVCTPRFIVARARRLATVIVTGGGAGVVIILAGGIDAGSHPVLMVLAVAAAVGVLGVSVKGWTRSTVH
ncbi:MAG: hypothetical protein ACR2LG_08340 [Actinomycetota bacterium]|nr:hypothetical protein [Actinomycetota bacterium]